MQPNRKSMKKVALIVTGVLMLVLYAIAEQHQTIEKEWGKWKELTLDGAHPKKPNTCIYCDYIKPLVDKYYGQEKK